MTILIIGGGGREHAVATEIAKSARCKRLLCAPGNGGTAQFCENFPVSATDIDGILALCKAEKVDFVVVTPDDPLAMGAVDRLEAAGYPCFGPTAAAAKIEASKAFAKQFMERHNIPTARCDIFESTDKALGFAQNCTLPIVVKADGLALGKGVIICDSRQQVIDAVHSLSSNASGATLVFEEFLQGPEVSQLCFADGKNYVLFPSAQDHKRAFDGDLGPNTGGMGVISPVPDYTSEIRDRVESEIIAPTMAAMASEGAPFKGVLYVSLMLTDDGPKVIEYNARFGDPETQALLPLLRSDLLDIMDNCRTGTLSDTEVVFHSDASCCVVMASGGYPGNYSKGLEISGIERAHRHGALVYHAGTAQKGGALVTSGGRVLGVVATASDLKSAVLGAYSAADMIEFDGAFFRRDLGARYL